MKTKIVTLLLVCLSCSSCRIWQGVFPPQPRYGQPIGAEKFCEPVMDKETKKALKKQRKFKD